jgi:hypothetical protein
MRVSVFAASPLLIALAVAMPCRASAPSAADIAVAQRSFDEARALFGAGKTAEACERFAQSQHLDPKLGTLLNLAICHEKLGKVASAWSEFHDARSIATAQALKERVQFADEHLATLAPLLSYVRIRMDAETRAGGPGVRLDDEPVDAAALDTDIPVDPGDHQIVVTSRDGRSWKGGARTARADKVAIVVPRLVPMLAKVPAPKAPPAGPAKEHASHGRRTAGLVTMGASLAVGALGGVFGFMAISTRKDAEAACAANQCADGRAKNDTGMAYAWSSNALLGVAGLAFVTGAILTLSDLGGSRTTVSLGPGSVGGTF